MSVVLDDPKTRMSRNAYFPAEDIPYASGREGLAVQENYRKAMRHWGERQQDAVSSQITDEDLEEEYVPIQFETIGTIQVRFKDAIPLAPRRIPTEDES
jgi:hypothetical protein